MRRRVLVASVLAPLLVLTVGGAVVLQRRSWPEGSLNGRWQTVFTGYGQVRGDHDELLLAPRPAASQEHTHAALVVSTSDHADLALTADIETRSQLRRGDPNAWEVGWVLWHYASPVRFYAIALKPNGWELSKQDAEAKGSQRFLASGTTPVFPVGGSYRVSVVQVGPEIKVAVDGHLLTTYTDSQEPYLSGRIGFYTEDAEVAFKNIHVADVAPAR